MSRPRKCRNVCCLPKLNRFGPLSGSLDRELWIQLAVDEYETIRLIDLMGLTQEECAMQMGIARTTVQGIYNIARKKLADCLVNGKPLTIEGGDYQLSDGKGSRCRKFKCPLRHEKRGMEHQ